MTSYHFCASATLIAPKRLTAVRSWRPLCRAEPLASPRGCRRVLFELSPRRLRLELSEFHSRRGRAGSTGNAHSARHRGGLLFGTFLLTEQETTQLRRRLICAFAQVMSEAKVPASGRNPDDVFLCPCCSTRCSAQRNPNCVSPPHPSLSRNGRGCLQRSGSGRALQAQRIAPDVLNPSVFSVPSVARALRITATGPPGADPVQCAPLRGV